MVDKVGVIVNALDYFSFLLATPELLGERRIVMLGARIEKIRVEKLPYLNIVGVRTLYILFITPVLFWGAVAVSVYRGWDPESGLVLGTLQLMVSFTALWPFVAISVFAVLASPHISQRQRFLRRKAPLSAADRCASACDPCAA